MTPPAPASNAPVASPEPNAAKTTAAQLFVKCLENEGVEFIFGVPGEENIDVMDALLDSPHQFVTTRHEQGAAFMADVYGRLTGRAGRVPGDARARARPTSSPAWPTPTWTARRWWPSPARARPRACTRKAIRSSIS